MRLGDLAISTGAVRLESTTSFFVHDGYPAVADYETVAALVEAAERLGHRSHVGVTATAPGFFGAQGRPIPQLPIRYPDLAEEIARQRVLNFEMETSSPCPGGPRPVPGRGRLSVYANRMTGEFVAGQQGRAEAACVETGLEGLTSWPRWTDRSESSVGSLATVTLAIACLIHARVERTRDNGSRDAPNRGGAMAEAYCVKDKKKVEV